MGDDWGEAPGEVAGWGGEEAVVDGWTLEAWAVGEVGRGVCLVGEAVGLPLVLMLVLVLGGVTSSTHSTLQLGAGVRLQGTNTLLLLLLLLPATCVLAAAAAVVVVATRALAVMVVVVEPQLACEGRSVPCSALWLWRSTV